MMVALELTVGALKKLYSDTCVFLVGEDVLDAVRHLAEDGIEILVLAPNGSVHRLDENTKALDSRAFPVGMAIGLRGIVAGSKTKKAAREWEAFSKRQKMHDLVPLKLLHGMPWTRKLAAARFILSRLQHQANDLQAQMGKKEAGLAFMRRKNEQLLLSYEKARRMIRGTGYGLQQIAMELPIGDETIGPGGTVDSTHLSQILPGDSAGLWGVSLYFTGNDDPEKDVKGHVEVTVFRASDGKQLASDKREFRHLREWCTFDLKEACGSVYGDAILNVAWYGEIDQAPLLALSSVEAERFGDAEGRTVALRLLKGLADIPEDMEEGTILPIDRKQIAVGDIFTSSRWAFGDAVPSKMDGHDLVTINQAEGWVQTHAQADSPSGIVVPGGLVEGTHDASVSIYTEHEAAPPCLYSLIAVEQAVSENPEARAEKVLSYLQTEAEGREAPEGVHAVHALVKARQHQMLNLVFDTPLKNKADLFMVVQSARKSAAYAWCRWSNLQLGGAFDDMITKLSGPKLTTAPMGLRMRSFHFPELAGRIEFVAGTSKLDELSKGLGFSPLLINEETGSLQTHPMKDHLSAAVLTGGVPSGTLRVASEIETAHDAAPAFMYMMAVVSSEVKERERVIRNVLSRIDPQNPKSWQGINSRKTVQWGAKTLFARRSDTIEIELALPLEGAADIVFAVKPVGESVAYGWCQWYSLNITTASGAGQMDGQGDDC